MYNFKKKLTSKLYIEQDLLIKLCVHVNKLFY